MITAKQKRILAELRSNSRQPMSRIAKKLKIPLSTAHDNYNSIKGCIKQRTTLVNFEKLGYSLKVNFIFRIRNNEIISLLLENKHVNSIYKVNNRRTVVAECIFKNICQAIVHIGADLIECVRVLF